MKTRFILCINLIALLLFTGFYPLYNQETGESFGREQGDKIIYARQAIFQKKTALYKPEGELNRIDVENGKILNYSRFIYHNGLLIRLEFLVALKINKTIKFRYLNRLLIFSRQLNGNNHPIMQSEYYYSIGGKLIKTRVFIHSSGETVNYLQDGNGNVIDIIREPN